MLTDISFNNSGVRISFHSDYLTSIGELIKIINSIANNFAFEATQLLGNDFISFYNDIETGVLSKGWYMVEIVRDAEGQTYIGWGNFN